MNDVQVNKDLIKAILAKLDDEDIVRKVFKSNFEYEMARTTCHTLLNINAIIEEYRYDHDFSKAGDKGLVLFGILQSLFVGIDCVYTIGKATGLNKLFINFNQNDVLRKIKHIRNDVVGHPSYRYYENNQVGFCALDLDNITQTKINYKVYTFEDKKVNINKVEVDILDSIDNYYLEINEILKETLNFFNLVSINKETMITPKISLLAKRFRQGIFDNKLLSEIKNSLVDTFQIIKKVSNRAIWRINLIEYLFNYSKKNDYTNYLTIQEMYKLYTLVFTFEKKINPKLLFDFNISQNQDFKLLRSKILKLKYLKRDILHDYHHPLYNQNMKVIINQFAKDASLSNLIIWIKENVDKKEEQMLYLIGSELKK